MAPSPSNKKPMHHACFPRVDSSDHRHGKHAEEVWRHRYRFGAAATG
jgi:hypothetical protein